MYSFILQGYKCMSSTYFGLLLFYAPKPAGSVKKRVSFPDLAITLECRHKPGKHIRDGMLSSQFVALAYIDLESSSLIFTSNWYVHSVSSINSRVELEKFKGGCYTPYRRNIFEITNIVCVFRHSLLIWPKRLSS